MRFIPRAKIYSVFLFMCVACSVVVHGQFDWTEVNITCPCTLVSTDGRSAQLKFGLRNYLGVLADELHATVAIVGEFTDPDQSYKESAFLDTVALDVSIEPHGNVDVSTIIQLGQIPNGRFYVELILHEFDEVKENSIVDSVWFEGAITTPVNQLDLEFLDFLVDSDGDGVADANERLQSFDPSDPNHIPEIPVIDLLILHSDRASRETNLDPRLFVTHQLAVTEFFFEQSKSPVVFRPVGLLGQEDESELVDLEETNWLDALPITEKLALKDEYQSDLTLVFRGSNSDLCGVAEDIGGIRGRGFIHPDRYAMYTEVFVDLRWCSINVTAHEIGHLMGLGHSFNQESVGAFNWSRGHGIEGQFGTIMSYARAAYQASDVNVFSNPDLDCQGLPCGVSHHLPNSEKAANAALSLNITKYQIANAGSPSSTFDIDGDGRGASVDAFPLDPSEWEDTDGDRYGNNSDAFPNDPLEWIDTDNDGIGDNSDPDIDNDGQPNLNDPDPFNGEISSIKLLRVVSDMENDRFGTVITQIADLDADGTRDLAVSAPLHDDSEDRTGAIYLFSMSDFTTAPDSNLNPGAEISLTDLRSDSDTWQILGSASDWLLGLQLLFLEHGEDSTPSSELLVVGNDFIYFISLASNDLSSFDALDGIVDRTIDLTHCVKESSCSRITHGSNFVIHGLANIDHFDDDNLSDIGILGLNPRTNVASLYLFTRQGIVDVLEDTEREAESIEELWSADETSLLIHVSGVPEFAGIANLGNTLGGPKSELGLGFAGGWGDPGRFYLLSTDQFSDTSVIDRDGDRRIAIEDTVGILKTYRITNELDSGFGRDVSALSDLNGDGKKDIFIWGDLQSHYVFTSINVQAMDIADSVLDASISLNESSQESSGVWLLVGGFSHDIPHQGVLSSSVGDEANGLVLPDQRNFLWASLQDLDYFDDPSGENLDGILDLADAIRYDNIYQFRLPFGPHGPPAYSGIHSLGDLDSDAILDFSISVHSEEESTLSSIYVVYSTSLPVLDRADGELDHFASLFNNFEDVDGDGEPNIFDVDDDGDGLTDELDHYPLHQAHQYDGDGDGFANALDAFPLNAFLHADLDQDGIGDRLDFDLDGDGILNWEDDFAYDTDNDGLENILDPDVDGDGIPDEVDPMLFDTDNDGIRNQEDADIDNDGIFNDEDHHPFDTDNDGERNDVDTDDDGDGVPDLEDAFPLDASEIQDTDGDGVGDATDLFIEDPTEWADIDQDGIGDNADLDDDNDGVEDTQDAFPLDGTESKDSDGDGYGDNIDVFPNNHLEWADMDEDGLGDNFGIAGFNSYRFHTPWFSDPHRVFEYDAIPEAQVVGDLDHDGMNDLVVKNAYLDGYKHPLFAISGGDLAMLDLLDGHNNQSIELNRIQERLNSWKFTNARRGFPSPKSFSSVATPLTGDDEPDLVISSPDDYFWRGAVYLLPTEHLATSDVLDGLGDSEVDYVRCVQNNDCIMVHGESEDQGLGYSTEILHDFFGEDVSALLISSLLSQPRQGNREDIGAAYVVSLDAINQTLENSADTKLSLDEVLTQENVLTIYPEQTAFQDGVVGTIGHRIADFNQDGADDFVLSQPDSDLVYVIQSDTLNTADAQDDTEDGLIDLGPLYRQPGSYKIEGFNHLTQSSHGSLPFGQAFDGSATHYLTFSDRSDSFLVDVDSLRSLDSADGTTDSVITEINPNAGSGIWAFPRTQNLVVCRDAENNGSGRLLVSEAAPTDDFIARNVSVYSVGLDKLHDLDAADGVSDGTVKLKNTLRQSIEGQWTITLGSFQDEMLSGLTIGCAGDMDQDGQLDYIVTIKQSDRTTDTYRTMVFLLMSQDFRVIDEMDGSSEHRLDISNLWPEN